MIEVTPETLRECNCTFSPKQFKHPTFAFIPSHICGHVNTFSTVTFAQPTHTHSHLLQTYIKCWMDDLTFVPPEMNDGTLVANIPSLCVPGIVQLAGRLI